MTRFKGATEIYDCPEFSPLPESVLPEYTVVADYLGDPLLIPNKITSVNLKITRNCGCGKAPLSVIAPEGAMVASISSSELELSAGESAEVSLELTTAPDAKILHKSNIFEVKIGDYTDNFGLMGGIVWQRFGPFLMNNCDIYETVAPHIPYSPFVPAIEGVSAYDALRDFHLNSFADINREFVCESEPFLSISADGRAECEVENIYTGEDLFDLADIQSYEGPHTDYLITTLVSPEDRKVEIALGHTAPYKLWINGKLVGSDCRSTWWTCENRHYIVELRKGENTVILKCAQQSHSARYSIIPKYENGCWLQHSDIDCKIVR